MMNIKTILCATDLSTESDEAMRYAIALARSYQAKIIVYHCAEVPPMAIISEVKHRVEETIKRHVGWIKEEGVEWEPAMGFIERGSNDQSASITREAADRGADLLIMQSHHRSYAAAVFGSVAEAVCHTAPCPVLVIHPLEHEFIDVATKEVRLKRILVGDDFSSYSTDALKFAFSLAQEFQSELHVVNVRPHGDNQSQDEDSVAQQIENRLGRLLPLEAQQPPAMKTVAREGKPEQEIIAYAEKQDVDLICVGSHGGGTGWGNFLGSTTDRVLRRAPCPVLVVRPAGDQEMRVAA